MKTSVEIRPYQPADKTRVLNIWLEASRQGHPFFSEKQLREQMALVGEVYLEKAENWVAVLDDEIAGFIGLLDTHIGGLFVDRALHGKGIGRALMVHAREMKKHLTLDVYALNQSAVGFYLHLGLRETSRQIEEEAADRLETISLSWHE